VTRTPSHFSPESPINGSTPRSRNSLDLLSLPLGILSIVTVEPPAPNLHELHDHNTRQMITNNYNYQHVAESHKQLQEITIGDEVLIRMHPERFSLGTLKKLHNRCKGQYKVLRRFGSSAISSIFPVLFGSARYSTSRT